MRSAGGVYGMKEEECVLKGKQFRSLENKIFLMVLNVEIMLLSLNINFTLSTVPSVLMKHYQLLMSQSSWPLSIF